MQLVLLIVGPILGGTLWIFGEISKEIIQREYPVWGPSLARRIVRITGAGCPRCYRATQRREWLVILRAYQEAGGSGLAWAFMTVRYLPGLYSASMHGAFRRALPRMIDNTLAWLDWLVVDLLPELIYLPVYWLLRMVLLLRSGAAIGIFIGGFIGLLYAAPMGMRAGAVLGLLGTFVVSLAFGLARESS